MAVYTHLNQSDIDEIGQLYGIQTRHFEAMDGGNAHTNYQISTSEGDYLLSLIEEKTKEEVEILVLILRWLEIHNFKTTRIKNTLKEKPAAKFQNKPVLLKKWIPGGVHEDFDLKMLEQIGAELAKLHQTPVPDFLPKGNTYGEKCYDEIVAAGIDADYENWLKERLPAIKNSFPKDLPQGFIHTDLFYDNIVFEGNQLQAIIDFEEAAEFYLAFDIGMAIIGTCRVNGKIDLPKVKALISGYESIRVLETAEKEHLPEFVQYAAIVTSCWRFWKYNLVAPNPERKYKHREMMELALEVEKKKSIFEY